MSEAAKKVDPATVAGTATSTTPAAGRKTRRPPAADRGVERGASAAQRQAPEPTAGVTLRFGGLPSRATLAETLALPVLPDLPALVYAKDALDQAVTERKGVALIGQKGAGKTMAVDAAVAEFDHVEDQRIARDRSQPRRTLLRLMSPRSTKRVQVIEAVHRALTGGPLETKERGRRIVEDELLENLVTALLAADVAALIVDEAEHLSDPGLSVIRDIISQAESRSKQRYAGDTYRAAGVGALLVGTPDLKHRLQASDEAGRRWLRMQDIKLLSTAQAAGVYRRFLPCLDREADARGEGAWKAFVGSLCPHRVPIAHLENHVRHYVRRMANHDPAIERIEDVPFVEEIFIGTWAERAGRPPAEDA